MLKKRIKLFLCSLKWKHFFCLTPLFAIFVLTFFYNSYNYNSILEQVSSNIANVSLNNTTTKSLNVNFELNKENATIDDLSNLIDISNSFRKNNVSKYFYNSRIVYNANKTQFNFINFNINPTIIVSNIFSNHKNDLGETVMDYYELKLMFETSNIRYDGYDNFCYITKNLADYLLMYNPNLTTYESLINFGLTVVSNNDTYVWKIANIILEGGDNEFYSDIYGDYVVSFTKLKNYDNPSLSFDFASSIKKNMDYLKFFKQNFSLDNYTIYINNNIANSDYLANDVLDGIKNIYITKDNSLLFVIFNIVIVFISLFAFIFSSYRTKINLLLSLFYYLLLYFVSYTIFQVMYLIDPKNILYFSSGAIYTTLVSLLLISIYVVFKLIKSHNKFKMVMKNEIKI